MTDVCPAVTEVAVVDKDSRLLSPPIKALEAKLHALSEFDRDVVGTWKHFGLYGPVRRQAEMLSYLWAFTSLGARVARALTTEMLAANTPLANLDESQMLVSETYTVRVASQAVVYEDLAYIQVLAWQVNELRPLLKPLEHIMRVFHVKPLTDTVPSAILRVNHVGGVEKVCSGYDLPQRPETLDVSLDLESYKTLTSFVSDLVLMLAMTANLLKTNLVGLHTKAAQWLTDAANHLLVPHLADLRPNEVRVYTNVLSSVAVYALDAKAGIADSGSVFLRETTKGNRLPPALVAYNGQEFRYTPEVQDSPEVTLAQQTFRECGENLKALKSRLYMEIKIKMKSADDTEIGGELLDV